MRHDGGIADKLMLQQPGGDLARLDAEAADLHLLVVAAQKLEIAVRQVARQVAGPVHPGAGLAAERIRQEPLRRQIGTVQVAARHPRPANIELANRPKRDGLTMVVEHIKLRVRDRTPDRHIPVRRLNSRVGKKGGRPNCSLRRTIKISERFYPSAEVRGQF
ncbi:hypothetical protein AJ87_09310 [Rhizobium yanglingense]|nr:hypothetical protein AJ87_09310 [Rhizobium yanglingense]